MWIVTFFFIAAAIKTIAVVKALLKIDILFIAHIADGICKCRLKAAPVTVVAEPAPAEEAEYSADDKKEKYKAQKEEG